MWSFAKKVGGGGGSAADPTSVWRGISRTQTFAPLETATTTTTTTTTAEVGGAVRVVSVSDTHGKHRDVSVPPGDILIHAGDFTNTGEPEQVRDFHAWMCEQPHAVKICIAGNHDTTFDGAYYLREGGGAQRFHPRKGPYDVEETRAVLVGSSEVRYLEDCELVVTRGMLGGGGEEGEEEEVVLRVWGSPWSPEFCDWAFNLDRGEPCREMWRRIPGDGAIDLLITHGPPLGRGDLCSNELRAGCVDLLEEVQQRIRPCAHIFGHVHEGYGVSSDGTTAFVNASSCTFQYRAENPAIVFDVVLDHQGEDADADDAGRPHRRVVFPPSAVCGWDAEAVQGWLSERRESEAAENATNIGQPDHVAEGSEIFTEAVCDALSALSGGELAELNTQTLGEIVGHLENMMMIKPRLALVRNIRDLVAANY